MTPTNQALRPATLSTDARRARALAAVYRYLLSLSGNAERGSQAAEARSAASGTGEGMNDEQP